MGINGFFLSTALFGGLTIIGGLLEIELAEMYFSLQNITAENDVNSTQSGAMTCISTLEFFDSHPEHAEYREKVIEMGRPFVQGELMWLNNHCNPITSETREACKQLYALENTPKVYG